MGGEVLGVEEIADAEVDGTDEDKGVDERKGLDWEEEERDGARLEEESGVTGAVVDETVKDNTDPEEEKLSMADDGMEEDDVLPGIRGTLEFEAYPGEPPELVGLEDHGEEPGSLPDDETELGAVLAESPVSEDRLYPVDRWIDDSGGPV